MRKLRFVPVLATVVSAFVLVVGTGTADADGADVVRFDTTCLLNAGTIGTFACTVQRVATPSGAVHYWIHGTVNAGDEPAKTLHVDNASTGQTCQDDAPNFKGVVTKSGNVRIQCRN
jgi:hypothetical protein